MLILTHTCSQSNTCPLCNSVLTGACSKETFGLKRGKSNWCNLAVWAILNTGADYILSWWPAHISLSGKRCVKVCVCVRAHTHTQPFMRCHSLLRHLYVRVLAAVRVHTLVPPVDVHTGLCVDALMFTCFTLVYVCGRRTAQNRTGTGQK